VALVTDDEGVSVSDMTHEYLRAVTDQHLDYRTLKSMARNSIAFSFADDRTKSRLRSELENAFTRFEETFVSPQPSRHVPSNTDPPIGLDPPAN
jgi:adenosine deaminase